MSHRHHGSDLIIAAVLGVLANAFPRTAGFIVLAMCGTALAAFVAAAIIALMRGYI